MKSASMEKNYLPEFFLACLGYFLFVSQDAIVKYIADSVLILKDGRSVESGKVRSIFSSPEHKYTKELLVANDINLN